MLFPICISIYFVLFLYKNNRDVMKGTGYWTSKIIGPNEMPFHHICSMQAHGDVFVARYIILN